MCGLSQDKRWVHDKKRSWENKTTVLSCGTKKVISISYFGTHSIRTHFCNWCDRILHFFFLSRSQSWKMCSPSTQFYLNAVHKVILKTRCTDVITMMWLWYMYVYACDFHQPSTINSVHIGRFDFYYLWILFVVCSPRIFCVYHFDVIIIGVIVSSSFSPVSVTAPSLILIHFQLTWVGYTQVPKVTAISTDDEAKQLPSNMHLSKAKTRSFIPFHRTMKKCPLICNTVRLNAGLGDEYDVTQCSDVHRKNV